MQELQDEILERIAVRLKAMGNPFRLKILHTLHMGERSVSEILAEVGGSQANVSKHLNILRSVNLVERRRDGANALYSIGDTTVFGICQAVCDSLLDRAAADVKLISDVRQSMLVGSPQPVEKSKS